MDRDKGDQDGEGRRCWVGLIWTQIKEWRGTESDEKMMDKRKYGNSFSGSNLITMSVMD